MKAIILAAGMGTRLWPLTLQTPKALVKVDGKPLLLHAIERLRAAGCDSFIVNVHHFASQITDYLAANNNFGLDITISDETGELLDTGGALKRVAPLIGDDEPLLVHNVDIFSNADLSGLYAEAIRTGADATLLVSERITSRYLLFGGGRAPHEEPLRGGEHCGGAGSSGEEPLRGCSQLGRAPHEEPLRGSGGMRLVGWTNVATGEVKTPFSAANVGADRVSARWPDRATPAAASTHTSPTPSRGSSPEEPAPTASTLVGAPHEEPARRLAFSGIHVISRRLLGAMSEWPDRFSIIDFYVRECASHEIVGHVQPGLSLLDVGRPEGLARAKEFIEEVKS